MKPLLSVLEIVLNARRTRNKVELEPVVVVSSQTKPHTYHPPT